MVESSWVARSRCRKPLLCVVLVSGWLTCATVYADDVANPAGDAAKPADDGGNSKAPSTPALGSVKASLDKSNYEGDRVTFAVPLDVDLREGSGDKEHCARTLPAGLGLRGVGPKTTDGSQLFVIQCYWKSDLEKCQKVKRCTQEQTIDTSPGAYVLISDSVLSQSAPDRWGWSYGALVVPFKFQLTRNREFTGSASVGPYLGYRFDKQGTLGWSLELVGFVGASNVSATDTNGSTKNLAGFTYGLGLLGVVKGNFQLGGVLGFDHVGSGQGFKYNDAPWLAVELGYSFSQ